MVPKTPICLIFPLILWFIVCYLVHVARDCSESANHFLKNRCCWYIQNNTHWVFDNHEILMILRSTDGLSLTDRSMLCPLVSWFLSGQSAGVSARLFMTWIYSVCLSHSVERLYLFGLWDSLIPQSSSIYWAPTLCWTLRMWRDAGHHRCPQVVHTGAEGQGSELYRGTDREGSQTSGGWTPLREWWERLIRRPGNTFSLENCPFSVQNSGNMVSASWDSIFFYVWDQKRGRHTWLSAPQAEWKELGTLWISPKF